MSRTEPTPSTTDSRALARQPRREVPAWLRGIYAGLCLYLFLAALNVLGAGLGGFGQASDFLADLFAYGENPFIALLAGVLVTMIVQSSSFTSALIVTLVASGEMTLGTAVFAIMGANIGTAVTGVIVALANMRIKRNFRRSFTAALLHDFFNILTVAVVFPIEWLSGMFHEAGRGIFTRFAAWLADMIGLEEVARPNSPIKLITAPVVDASNWLGGALMPSPAAQGLFVAGLGLLLMFIALVFMVQNLRGALLRHMDGLFRTYFFRTDLRAYGVGVVSTVLVQSSTITSSLMVPLAGAGVVSIRRVLPFMMGANLGTTVTSVLAATANPIAAALTVALFHVTFNVVGTLIWYPLRRIPLRVATWYGKLAAKKTRYAFAFLIGVFLVIPLLGIAATELFTSLR
ncbi:MULTISPECIES: Na/Pi symporter [Halomonadaceae]|uniref:Na/Pi symporter n=1 Tax=Halomonadaceae TaxID=28256 RepID=UPI0015974E49|nr:MULTISPECIES: Na/Pi symporter [Halomonas]QJQ93884.1 Na/Pi symporter [Halomonas sp. PA5]